MTRFFPLLCLILLSLSSACDLTPDDITQPSVGNADIVGASVSTSEVRLTAAFDVVSTADNLGARVIPGDEFSVTVTANIPLELIRTEVVDGVLTIDKAPGRYGQVRTEIVVTLPELSEVRTRGNGDIVVADFQDLERLTLFVRANGHILVENVTTEHVAVAVRSNGDVEAFGLLTNSAAVDLTSNGDAEITVREVLTGNMSGNGDLFFRGRPDVRVTVSGNGEVRDAN